MWVNGFNGKTWVEDMPDFYDILEQNEPITKEKAISMIDKLADNYLKQSAPREKINEKQVKKKYRSLLYSSLEKEYECGFAYGLRTAKAILSYLETNKKDDNND